MENDADQTVVTYPVEASANEIRSFLCASCAFSWLEAFSGSSLPRRNVPRPLCCRWNDPEFGSWGWM